MKRDSEILAVGMGEAARLLSLSPRTIATLVLNGTLKSRKIGRRRLIAMSDLREFLNGKESNPLGFLSEHDS